MSWTKVYPSEKENVVADDKKERILNCQMNFVKFYLFVIYFITFNGGLVKCVYGDVNKSASANSIINNTTKQPLEDCSETIMKEVELLKQEVDKVLRLSDEEYETIISRYLGRNFTLRKRDFDVGNSTKTTRDSKTFMEKVKEKFGNFLDFFRRIGTKNLEAETRMKRCLMEDSYEDFDDEGGFDNFPPNDEISIDEKILTSMTSDELEKYLKKLIKCINSDEPSKQRYEGASSLTGNETQEKDENSDYHTKSSYKISDDQAATHNCSIQNNHQAEQQPTDNKFHKISKFLANVQHPVELTGKLSQKSINLENINEFLKKLKSFNQDLSYNNEENDIGKETTEAADDPVFTGIDHSFPLIRQVKRNTRNVFDDFSKSIRGLLVNEKSKQASNSRDNKDFIEERKSSQLMESLETPRVEKEPEEEPVQENVHEEEVVNEGEGLQNDLDGFKSRINPGQQVEIMNFLKQLNQGPKPFSFDTESFFQSQIDKMDHSKDKQTNEDTNTSNSIGRKYFEFEAEEKKDKSVDVVKRNTESDNNWEELKNIAKIKSKLIYDYKNYHSDISQFLHDYKKPEVSKHEINMVDNYFLLNDGKTKLEDFMKKPERVDSKMNLFDLNLDLQLDKEFQDLEYEKQLNQKSMFPSIDDDVSKIPLKKPFEFINTEDYLP